MFAVCVDDQPIATRAAIGFAAALLISCCGNARRFERNAEGGNDDVAQRCWHGISSPSEPLDAAARHAWHLIVPDVCKRDLRAIRMGLACVGARDMLTVKDDMGG